MFVIEKSLFDCIFYCKLCKNIVGHVRWAYEGGSGGDFCLIIFVPHFG